MKFNLKKFIDKIYFLDLGSANSEIKIYVDKEIYLYFILSIILSILSGILIFYFLWS